MCASVGWGGAAGPVCGGCTLWEVGMKAGDPGPQAPQLAEGSVLGPGETSCWQPRAAAGEEHGLNADAASQHLAGILSVSQTQATYLK